MGEQFGPGTDSWREAVLRTGGTMASLVAGFDWARNPLGPIDTWPESLRTAVGVCLSSRFPILLWWGPELVMIYNDAYRPMLGESKHPQALGMPGRTVWPEVWDVIGPMLRGVLDGRGATWSDDQLLLLDRNGYLEECYFTFSYSPILDSSGRVEGVFCAVTETTERILGERRLATLESLAARLVEATDVDEACRTAADRLVANVEDVRFAEVHLREDDGSFRRVTDGAADTAPWPLDEVARTGVAQLVDAPAVAGSGQAYLMPVREPGGGKASAVLVAGVSERRPFDSAYRSFLELAAKHIGTAISGARAFAAEKQRARALAELDAAKTTFFSDISHELRTPLTLIAGPVHDALADTHDVLSPRHRRRLELVSRNANRLRRLVDTMLDLARIEGGRMVPEPVALDLARVTADLATNFVPAMDRAGLRFTVDTPPLPRPVHVDHDMWDQIVLNLLSNAVKYTLGGEVGLALRDGGDHVELSVVDTGVGIADEDIPRLFERFHRVRGTGARSHEGTGIGLALVAELLRLLGGSISVESTPAEGSTFRVRLPYGRSAAEPGPAAVTSSDASSSDVVDSKVEEALSWSSDTTAFPPPERQGLPRLLVAEDNADLRAYLLDTLSVDYRVELAVNGRDALQRIRSTPPDMLLADVMMPELDGFGLLAEVRNDPQLSGIPVLLLSARAGEEAAAEGFTAGADDYLVKPFSAQDLLTRLGSNLARSKARTRDAAWRAAMLRSLHEGVFVADATGAVIEVNDAFERITGWGMKNAPYLAPHPWWPTQEQDAEAHRLLDESFARLLTEPASRCEVQIRHREGHPIWVSIAAAKINTADNGDQMLVGTVRHISRERGLRERSRAAATLTAALSTETGIQQLYAAAAHGFGDVFGGKAFILVERKRGFTVITTEGEDEEQSQAEVVRAEIRAAASTEDQSMSLAPGLLIRTAIGHSVWVRFHSPRTVTADERLIATMLSDVLSTGLDRALLTADRRHTEDNLRVAMESHRFIGQAVGILMERHRLTAAAAFTRLRTASQSRNVKLRTVAEQVIRTGEDPHTTLADPAARPAT